MFDDEQMDDLKENARDGSNGDLYEVNCDEDNDEMHLYRIHPIFSEGTILMDGYNFKIEGYDDKRKARLGIKFNGGFFDDEGRYNVIEKINWFERDNNGGESTFITIDDLDRNLLEHLGDLLHDWESCFRKRSLSNVLNPKTNKLFKNSWEYFEYIQKNKLSKYEVIFVRKENNDYN